MATHVDPKVETLAETDNYIIWKASEPDGEITYNIELNAVTLHFFNEEWDEFCELMKNLLAEKKR